MSKVIINCIAKSIICRETDSREFDYRQSRTESRKLWHIDGLILFKDCPSPLVVE